MAFHCNDTVVALFADKETVKILATVDDQGIVHVVSKQSLSLDADGNIILYELLETSRSNRNLLASLWRDRLVTVLVTGKNGISFEIKGRPLKAIVAGPKFQEHYVRLRERRGDADLAAVWVIEPVSASDETFAHRLDAEQQAHPLFVHLDRLALNSDR